MSHICKTSVFNLEITGFRIVCVTHMRNWIKVFNPETRVPEFPGWRTDGIPKSRDSEITGFRNHRIRNNEIPNSLCHTYAKLNWGFQSRNSGSRNPGILMNFLFLKSRTELSDPEKSWNSVFFLNCVCTQSNNVDRFLTTSRHRLFRWNY